MPSTQALLEDIQMQIISRVIFAIGSELSVPDHMLYLTNICGRQTLSALSVKADLTLFLVKVSPPDL